MCGDWRLEIGDCRLVPLMRQINCAADRHSVSQGALKEGHSRLGCRVWADTLVDPYVPSPRLPGRADTPVGPYIPWAYAIRPYILARLLLVSLVGPTRRSAPTFHGRMRYAPTCPWAYAIRPYILARLLPVSLVGSTRRSAPTCPWAYAIRPYTPTPLLPFTYFGSVPQMSVPLR
jgi:hypothetical protein